MQLEVGKKYLMRNGGVTGVIRLSNSTDTFYPASDGKYYWTDEGHYYCDFTESEFDIVSEYVEPEEVGSRSVFTLLENGKRMRVALNSIHFCASESETFGEQELREMMNFIKHVAEKGLE